jgi:hypothetical protein
MTTHRLTLPFSPRNLLPETTWLSPPPHPPYSPDLVPGVSSLFPRLNLWLYRLSFSESILSIYMIFTFAQLKMVTQICVPPHIWYTRLVKIMLTFKLVGLALQFVLQTSEGLRLANHTLPSSLQPLIRKTNHLCSQLYLLYIHTTTCFGLHRPS